MVMSRTQHFKLIGQALEMMRSSTRMLSFHVWATAPAPVEWISFEIQREEWDDTITICEGMGITVAIGCTSTTERLRSLIRPQNVIEHISLQGPGAFDEDSEHLTLYETNARNAIPLPRRRRSSNDHPGGFRLEPVRRR